MMRENLQRLIHSSKLEEVHSPFTIDDLSNRQSFGLCTSFLQSPESVGHGATKSFSGKRVH